MIRVGVRGRHFYGSVGPVLGLVIALVWVWGALVVGVWRVYIWLFKQMRKLARARRERIAREYAIEQMIRAQRENGTDHWR